MKGNHSASREMQLEKQIGGVAEPEGKRGRPVRQEKQAPARLGRAGTPGTLGPRKAQRGREEEGSLDTR